MYIFDNTLYSNTKEVVETFDNHYAAYIAFMNVERQYAPLTKNAISEGDLIKITNLCGSRDWINK